MEREDIYRAMDLPETQHVQPENPPSMTPTREQLYPLGGITCGWEQGEEVIIFPPLSPSERTWHPTDD